MELDLKPLVESARDAAASLVITTNHPGCPGASRGERKAVNNFIAIGWHIGVITMLATLASRGIISTEAMVAYTSPEGLRHGKRMIDQLSQELTEATDPERN